MLAVDGVSKHYRNGRGIVAALSGVGFRLPAGSTLGIVGESGSGKSTMARIACGLLAPDAGSVRLAGTELVGLAVRDMRRLRRRVQMIFQDPLSSLDPRQRVSAAIEEVLAVHGLGDRRSRRASAGQMLELVGLPAAAGERYPHQFSGGQRQRVAIARALVLKPDLLICDEPVSALDVSIQAQVLNLLVRLKRELNLTMLFISHDLSVVAHVADHIGVMQRGRMVEMGAAEDVFRRPQHEYTQTLLASVPRLPREAARAQHAAPGVAGKADDHCHGLLYASSAAECMPRPLRFPSSS
ncbi:ATP-binding cassette domain-containing protein [Verticiella sediminum]|nr:ATP-binding cassette domain-containing protein [Verticiella sediminum]